MNSPAPTTSTAISMLSTVTGTLYLITSPGMVYPSIAMKCMAQMPETPIDTAARVSHRPRAAPE